MKNSSGMVGSQPPACEYGADGNVELEGIVARQCTTHEDTDDALRSFLELAAIHKRMLGPDEMAFGLIALTAARGVSTIGV